MRARVILLLSLGLNLTLAYLLFTSSPVEVVHIARGGSVVRSTNVTQRPARTRVVVRRQNFTWSEIEAEDYMTYISNLRSIACPEQTIRDIIVADVNEIYARKRATEVITAEAQWWKSEPDMDVTEAASAKLQLLEAERRTLLTQLLGPGWETSAYYTMNAPGVSTSLDGPVLGALSPEARMAVRNLELQSVQKLREYTEAQQRDGREPDPAELARMRKETRDELAKLLTPVQLEEYLLRYSNHAQSLRQELRGLDATPDEFRTLFKLRDPIEQQLQQQASGSDPNAAKLRTELQNQLEEIAKQVLGPDRYKIYKLVQDPVFREAQSTAEQAGAPPEAVLPLYQIEQATARERQRLQSDRTLSPEEVAAQIDAVTRDQQQSIRQLLGDDVYEAYRQGRTQ